MKPRPGDTAVNVTYLIRGMPALSLGLASVLERSGMKAVATSHPPGPSDSSLLIILHRMDERPTPPPSSWSCCGRVLAAKSAPDFPFYAESLRLGYSAVLDCQGNAETLVDSVRAALHGLVVVPHKYADLVFSISNDDSPTLEQDERRWLEHLASGRSIADLAQVAGYSERETYRRLRSIYDKLGVGSRAAAIAKAARTGQIRTLDS